MLIRPSQLHPDSAFPQKPANQSLQPTLQHGQPHLILIPVESLAHITSFLDPPGLVALSAVNKYLREHVQDDNTWQKAFFCQLLSIAPESNPLKTSTLLLRRTETTWKNEFITRYKLKRHANPPIPLHLLADYTCNQKALGTFSHHHSHTLPARLSHRRLAPYASTRSVDLFTPIRHRISLAPDDRKNSPWLPRCFWHRTRNWQPQS
jgi:hypothetical protein